ncbi:MAG: hypothetical protein HY744_29955 [Deltaproteobacteria bacterium]|nr:hypothetical protein [Deltaproteobacteria bacterium]
MSGTASRQRRRGPWLARAALVLALVLDAALVGLCVLALRGSPRLEVEIDRGAVCPWQVELPAATAAGVGWSREPVVACVRAIAGVPLRPASLVREAMYLGSSAELHDWLTDQTALHEALGGRDSAALELAGPHGRRGLLAVTVLGFAPGSVLGVVLPPVLAALGIALIGLLVLLRRPDRRAAWALFAFSQAVAACLLPTMVNAARGIAVAPVAAVLLLDVNRLGLVVGAASLLHLAAIFPAWRLGRHTTLLGLGLPMVLGALALGLELSGAWWGAVLAATAVLALAALALVATTQLAVTSPIQRLQAQWMLWGLAVPVVVWLVARIPYIAGGLGGGDPTDELVALGGLAIPAGVAVAVLRYRLLDIDVVVRRTILGAVLTAAALFVYALGLSAFAGEIADTHARGSGFGAVLVTALVLGFVLLPMQSRIESGLDRIFFRNRWHYRRALALLPDDLALVDSPEEAATRVVSRVCAAMAVPRAVVALAPDGLCAERAWAQGAGGKGRSAPRALLPPSHSEFWDEVAIIDGPHLCDSGWRAGLVDRWMGEAQLDLLLPLHTPDALVGLLACAGPAGRKVVSGEDVAVLHSVASSLALALSRTTAMETIRRMNEELEQRVTDRTAELEHARVRLYQWEKMASLGVLAAGVAHELNTPLGVILSSADQLAARLSPGTGEGEPPREARMARLCLEAARRAADIVAALRQYSRPEAEGVQPVDLGAVVDSTLRLVGSVLRSRRIEVSRSLGDVPLIDGYPALVTQTLTNLVLNAAAAIGTDGEIRIAAECRSEGHVAVIVEDTGPGVPEEIHARIFEPFFTTKPPGEGTGLGLALCYAFVEQHGGRIWEEGEPGKGARFVVELPVTPPRR